MKEKDENEWDGVMDVLFTTFFSQDFKFKEDGSEDNNAPAAPVVNYRLKNYKVTGNEFYINSPLRALIGLTCDALTSYEDVEISNNLIRYGEWVESNTQVQDFVIKADKINESSTTSSVATSGNLDKLNLEEIKILNNTVDCRCVSYMVYDENTEEHYFIIASNTRVLAQNNVVRMNPERFLLKGAESVSTKNGLTILYSTEKSAFVRFVGNQFTGVGMICLIRKDFSDGYNTVQLSFEDNTIEGKILNLIRYLDYGLIDFTRNTFFATSTDTNRIPFINGAFLRGTVRLCENVFSCDEQSSTPYFIESTQDDYHVLLLSAKNKFYGVTEDFYNEYHNEQINVHSVADNFFG